MESLLKPQEIAKSWQLSYDKVLEIFRDEPGVMVIANENPRKRKYRTIRIPKDVAERVRRRMTNPV